jgi:hypothetical protein
MTTGAPFDRAQGMLGGFARETLTWLWLCRARSFVIVIRRLEEMKKRIQWQI